MSLLAVTGSVLGSDLSAHTALRPSPTMLTLLQHRVPLLSSGTFAYLLKLLVTLVTSITSPHAAATAATKY